MAELTNEEKSAALGEIDFFAGCTEKQLTEIAHLADGRSAAVGEELCHEGDFDQHVFVILEGEATASVGGGIIGKVRAGEVVGELAMLGDGHRRATLLAETSMRALVLEAEEVDFVLMADPGAVRELGPEATRPHTEG